MQIVVSTIGYVKSNTFKYTIYRSCCWEDCRYYTYLQSLEAFYIAPIHINPNKLHPMCLVENSILFEKKNSQYQIRRHIASSRLVSRRQDPQIKLSYTSKCDRQTGRTAVKFPSDLTTLLQVMRFSYTFLCISVLDYVWHRYLYAVYYRI